jgi:methionine synthase II (cobalamin-independent)
MAYIGCIVTQSPRAESAQEVCDQLITAAKYIDKQRLGSTGDCGFSPFSIVRVRDLRYIRYLTPP